MYYAIILTGVLLLLFSQYKKGKLQQQIVNEPVRHRPAAIVGWLYAITNEWAGYAIKQRTVRGMKNLIIAVTGGVAMFAFNAAWLRFNSLFVLILILVCAFVIQIYIGRALHRRDFENQFPEILSTVTAAVSAGNSINQALHRCGERVDGELGELFNRVDRRLNLGEDPERVLKEAWETYRYQEFYFFNIVMLVSLQRGGQLRVLISRLSRVIANSKNIARRKKALTSEARTSAKIVSAIPILFFILMKYLSPENFDFVINDPMGRIILYYVIASELIGMGIIWFLLKRAT